VITAASLAFPLRADDMTTLRLEVIFHRFHRAVAPDSVPTMVHSRFPIEVRHVGLPRLLVSPAYWSLRQEKGDEYLVADRRRDSDRDARLAGRHGDVPALVAMVPGLRRDAAVHDLPTTDGAYMTIYESASLIVRLAAAQGEVDRHVVSASAKITSVCSGVSR
jgi:hypothetical protein